MLPHLGIFVAHVMLNLMPSLESHCSYLHFKCLVNRKFPCLRRYSVSNILRQRHYTISLHGFEFRCCLAAYSPLALRELSLDKILAYLDIIHIIQYYSESYKVLHLMICIVILTYIRKLCYYRIFTLDAVKNSVINTAPVKRSFYNLPHIVRNRLRHRYLRYLLSECFDIVVIQIYMSVYNFIIILIHSVTCSMPQ